MAININIKPILEKLAGNGITLVWLQDPITKLPSVSLSNLVIAMVLLILSVMSNYFACLKGLNGDLAFNYFMASAALYFSRKISINGKTASSEKVE